MDVTAVDEVLAMPEHQFKKTLQGLQMEVANSVLCYIVHLQMDSTSSKGL